MCGGWFPVLFHIIEDAVLKYIIYKQVFSDGVYSDVLFYNILDIVFKYFINKQVLSDGRRYAWLQVWVQSTAVRIFFPPTTMDLMLPILNNGQQTV